MILIKKWSLFIFGFTGANSLNKFISGIGYESTFLQTLYIIGFLASFIAGYFFTKKIDIKD